MKQNSTPGSARNDPVLLYSSSDEEGKATCAFQQQVSRSLACLKQCNHTRDSGDTKDLFGKIESFFGLIKNCSPMDKKFNDNFLNENASPNVVCLPSGQRIEWLIRLPDAVPGQDQDPSNETIAATSQFSTTSLSLWTTKTRRRTWSSRKWIMPAPLPFLLVPPSPMMARAESCVWSSFHWMQGHAAGCWEMCEADVVSPSWSWLHPTSNCGGRSHLTCNFTIVLSSSCWASLTSIWLVARRT